MTYVSQYHEALQCPKCPDVFVESLWSLIAHVNCAHPEMSDLLTFSSLQKCKAVVVKSKVCVVRPAFKEDGSRNDYLNFGPDGCYLAGSEGASTASIPTSLDAEMRESTMTPTPPSFIHFNSVLDMISNVSNNKNIICKSQTPESDSTVSSDVKTHTVARKLRRQESYTSRSAKKLFCQTCGEIFDNRCLLTLHMMSHKKKTHPYQCTISGCFQCYDTKLKFKSHLTRVHRDLTTRQVEDLIQSSKRQTNNPKNGLKMEQDLQQNYKNDTKDTVVSVVVDVKKEIL